MLYSGLHSRQALHIDIAGRLGFQRTGTHHVDHVKSNGIFQRFVDRFERAGHIAGNISGAAARVNLKKGLVTILYAREIDDQTIREKIEKAGYTLTGPL